MNRRWLCSDVWMDILPSFDHAQLGLKMALLSDRFDVLVDAHFDGKSEFTIWRTIRIVKDEGPKAKLSVWTDGNVSIDGKRVEFPLPDHSLPNKICFKNLQIHYIDHSVIKFLRSKKPIWDRRGTNLEVLVDAFDTDVQPIWDVFVSQIWPIFATNIRHLCIPNGAHLDNLRRLISPTFLTDLDQLISIDSGALLRDGIADDGPNATAGQALAKWLHTPTKNGQPKQLRFLAYVSPPNLEWLNNFKETFRHATTSVSYNIQLYFRMEPTPIESFELLNGRTKEKLTLKQEIEALSNGIIYNWLLQRCPIGETAMAPVKWKNRENSDANANLNKLLFDLWGGNDPIGPLSPPVEEEKYEEDKADKRNQNGV